MDLGWSWIIFVVSCRQTQYQDTMSLCDTWYVVSSSVRQRSLLQPHPCPTPEVVLPGMVFWARVVTRVYQLGLNWEGILLLHLLGKKTVEAIKPLEELGNPLGIPWEFVGNPLDALDRHTQRATESQWSWSSPSPPGRWLQVLEPLAASSWMAACCLGETVATVWTYSNRSCSKFEFKLLFIHDMSCSFTSSGTRSEMKTSSP